METPAPPPASAWLLRIPAVFDKLAGDITAGLMNKTAVRLGKEFHLVHPSDPAAMRSSAVFRFVSWNLPLHHAWPCCPPKMGQFVEKAAQALARKFAPLEPQTVLVGSLQGGAAGSYYRRLASNLRGRVLQLLPPLPHQGDPQAQDPVAPTLFCLVGTEGLFCGLQSPRQSNGFFPGGTRHVRQDSKTAVSRAGAKLAEALHFLRLHRLPPATGTRWLELGASPGGMTVELLDRGCRVTAVDRAPLDPRLDGRPGLDFIRADVARWQPRAGEGFDGILCDLNGDARDSIQQVARLSRHLRPEGIVIFTLKLGAAATITAIDALHAEVVAIARQAGLTLFAQTHLTYNRREFTLFFAPPGQGPDCPRDPQAVAGGLDA